jgi:hypothetical protein
MTTNKNYTKFDWDKVKTVDDIKSFLKAIHPRVQVDRDSKEYDILSHLCDDKGYEVGTLEQAEEFAKKRNYAYCNGFCGEYECKENQANCKRLKK